MGLTLAPLDAESRRAAGVDDDTKGVLIVDVAADSPLAEKGVEPGSVLLSVAGEPVASPDEAAERIAAAEAKGGRCVLLLIPHNRGARFVAAPLNQG
ncbi:MAG: PDZ domain-containing protein [Alphaproteobacteria bacterium]